MLLVPVSSVICAVGQELVVGLLGTRVCPERQRVVGAGFCAAGLAAQQPPRPTAGPGKARRPLEALFGGTERKQLTEGAAASCNCTTATLCMDFQRSVRKMIHADNSKNCIIHEVCNVMSRLHRVVEVMPDVSSGESMDTQPLEDPRQQKNPANWILGWSQRRGFQQSLQLISSWVLAQLLQAGFCGRSEAQDSQWRSQLPKC